MKSAEQLIKSLKNFARQIDETKIKSDSEMIGSLRQYLSNDQYEVKVRVKLRKVQSGADTIKNLRESSDLVVKVEDEYIPIEVKVNGDVREYKRYIGQIQSYVHYYHDVPCSLVMFITQNMDEDDIYNLRWKQSQSSSKYRFIIGKYATYRDDHSVFVRKSPTANFVSNSWSHKSTRSLPE